MRPSKGQSVECRLREFIQNKVFSVNWKTKKEFVNIFVFCFRYSVRSKNSSQT
jgi:hypothetical protein